MYEVCRVQKLSAGELAQFDDQFIDHLFEMVETTRDYQDERLNYAVIRLIVSNPDDSGAKLITGRAERAIYGGYFTDKTNENHHYHRADAIYSDFLGRARTSHADIAYLPRIVHSSCETETSFCRCASEAPSSVQHRLDRVQP